MNPVAFDSPPTDACQLGSQGIYGPDRISRFTYDAFDQVLTEERALGTSIAQTYVTNTYHGRGVLQTQTDAKGNKTELRYDSNWRLFKRVYPSPSTRVYVIKTTPEQDAAVLNYFRGFKDTTLPGDPKSVYLSDNCSVRVNEALSAAGIVSPMIHRPHGGMISSPENLPGSAGFRALASGAERFDIPKSSASIPDELAQFEPQ